MGLFGSDIESRCRGPRWQATNSMGNPILAASPRERNENPKQSDVFRESGGQASGAYFLKRRKTVTAKASAIFSSTEYPVSPIGQAAPP